MEIKIPVTTLSQKKIIIKDEEAFKKDLITFIDNIENKDIMDEDLYNKLLGYGIVQSAFDQMIDRVKVFSSYDDNKNDIGFPYEDWIQKLTEYYDAEVN